DEAIAIAALAQGQTHFPLARTAARLHRCRHRRPVIEIARDQHLLGLRELRAEDDILADLFDAVELIELLLGGFMFQNHRAAAAVAAATGHRGGHAARTASGHTARHT